MLPATDTERFKACQNESKQYYEMCKASVCFDDASADALVGTKVTDGRVVWHRVRTAGAHGVRDEVSAARSLGKLVRCYV